MPIAGTTGHLEDESATSNVFLPESALTKPTERTCKELEHFREIRLIDDGKGKEFNAVSLRRFRLAKDPIEAAPHPREARRRAHRTEPVAAVDRNGELMSTVPTNDCCKLMLIHFSTLVREV